MDGAVGNSGGPSRLSKRRKPGIEPCEGRLLLSTVTGIKQAQVQAPTQTRAQAAAGFPQSGGILGTALSTGVDPAVIAGGVGVPTRHEASRNAFVAKFAGNYDSVGGRTSELAATTRLAANGAWTNILKGSTLAILSTPKPSATNPGFAQGIVELNPRSISVTGQLILRVEGTVGDTNLPTPTKLTWVVDPTSSGAYNNATGQGTVELRYFPKGPRNGGTTGSFRMIITGTLIRSGLPF
ncbi:hypothetical protein EP7_001203 [Isosphaeraceae bacterium EP7]